jgi:hypothetical protein
VDVSQLRQRILHALDAARKDATSRRAEMDQAAAAYAAFLETVAVPLLKQAQSVLRAEHQVFSVHAPAGSARLVNDAAQQTFVELSLDTSGAQPQVLGRVSITRGRQGVVVEERAIAPGTPIANLTDAEVAEFLVTAIPKLVVKT